MIWQGTLLYLYAKIYDSHICVIKCIQNICLAKIQFFKLKIILLDDIIYLNKKFLYARYNLGFYIYINVWQPTMLYSVIYDVIKYLEGVHGKQIYSLEYVADWHWPRNKLVLILQRHISYVLHFPVDVYQWHRPLPYVVDRPAQLYCQTCHWYWTYYPFVGRHVILGKRKKTNNLNSMCTKKLTVRNVTRIKIYYVVPWKNRMKLYYLCTLQSVLMR